MAVSIVMTADSVSACMQSGCSLPVIWYVAPTCHDLALPLFLLLDTLLFVDWSGEVVKMKSQPPPPSSLYLFPNPSTVQAIELTRACHVVAGPTIAEDGGHVFPQQNQQSLHPACSCMLEPCLFVSIIYVPMHIVVNGGKRG